MFAGALLVALAVGLTVTAPRQRSRPEGPSQGALQPVGGEQAGASNARPTTAPKPTPARTTTAPSRSDPSPTSEPDEPSGFYEVQGAPRVIDIRCFYAISSDGGRCRYRIRILNDSNSTLSSLEVELKLAPENDPYEERAFEVTTNRYQTHAPDESTEVFIDVPSMEIGFYHTRACILGYRWLHPDEGWKHSDELSCKGELLYAGPG